jgi:hypothetical protein
MQMAELKTAFRKLAVQYHPDKALAGCAATCSLSGVVSTSRDDDLHARLRTSANELFQLVNEAWETLQDTSKRQICRMEHDSGVPSHLYTCLQMLIQYSLVYPATYDPTRSEWINARTGLSNTTQMLVHCLPHQF